jgi:DMSO/TMAO reductase YedYZ molybdopterin-dependent catalytic subunit
MKESESQLAPSQVAPVANAAGSPILRITSSDVQRENRIPPRQVLTRKWPVLHAGSVPDYAYFDPLSRSHQDWRSRWTFRIWGLIEAPWQCNYHEFIARPRVEVRADMHCATRWSKLDNVWEGVSTRTVLRKEKVLPDKVIPFLGMPASRLAKKVVHPLPREDQIGQGLGPAVPVRNALLPACGTVVLPANIPFAPGISRSADSPRRAKADIVARVLRREPITAGGTHAPGVSERAATKHTGF